MRTRDVARQRAIERKEPMELARQLRAKREERGLSQDEVSKAIFVSRQTISNWENYATADADTMGGAYLGMHVLDPELAIENLKELAAQRP